MKKVISLLAVPMLIAYMLTGCGGSAPVASTEAAESTVETAAEVPEEVKTLKVGMMGTSIKPVCVLVADANGYFDEEGVNVEFEKVSSMNDAYLATSTGDLDVYLFSSTAAATFISQGTTTLRVFGGTVSEGSEIMAKAGSNYKLESAEDFKGLKIGCFMAETGQMVLKNWLMSEGVTIGGEGDNADVTFIYYSDDASGIEAVKNGTYDLVLTNSAKGYYAEDFGVDVVALVSDFVPIYPCCRQTCNQTTYENNFDALVKFETATLRGYQYMRENKEGTLDILENYSGQDRGFLEGQIYGNDKYTPAMHISLDPDKKACVAFYEAMMNLGEIQDTIDVDWNDYVVTDVYSTALEIMSEKEPDNQLWKDMTEYFNSHN